MRFVSIVAVALLAIGATAMQSTQSLFGLSPVIAPALAAAEQRVVFAIENMTCALCPVTVKTAMQRVAGVKSVVVDFQAKTATATFDPSVTTAEAVAAASTNAGYPAHPAAR